MTGKATKKTASVDTKVEAVRRFFADSKPENHPIKEHSVSKQEEYVRDLYLEMLCVMAQYESSNTENAFTLIKRIMAACKETLPLEEYIKRSMEITPERAAEFVKQCKDNGLREIFMVDSMLLSCANGEPNAKQVAFITEFGDMLGFDKTLLEDMSRFALAILEQDSDGYQKLLKDENAAVQESLLAYAKEFVSGIIILSTKQLYIFSSDTDNCCDNIFIDPLRFRVEKLQSYHRHETCTISNIERVIMENISLKKTALSFSSVKLVQIINCKFTDYKISHYIVHTNGVESFQIKQCTFRNIDAGCSYESLLEVFGTKKILLENLTAENIKRKNAHYSSYSLFLELGSDFSEFLMSDCKFDNLIPDGDYDLKKYCYPIIMVSDRLKKDCSFVIKNNKISNCNLGISLFSHKPTNVYNLVNTFGNCIKPI